jgi:hypothetical protein
LDIEGNVDLITADHAASLETRKRFSLAATGK